MPNLIKTLKARMLNDRGLNKAFPCKTYATEAAAEKAVAGAATEYAERLCTHPDDKYQPDYVVFYMEDWGRWVGAFNAQQVLMRKSAGGYIGSNSGIYAY